VQLVKSFLHEDKFEDLFRLRNEVYTYDGFLKAVGKFPALCGEHNEEANDDDDLTACKKEIAAIFANFVKETSYNSAWEANREGGTPFYKQGLYEIEQQGCSGSFSWGGWTEDAYPSTPNKSYCGRGPFQLTYNFNYGMFSNVFVESKYDSKKYFLDNPEQVGTDGYTAFAAGLWYYMTPQSPKPSMHDVMTGYFIPTAVDEGEGIKGGFGTAINVLNGGVECGPGTGAWAAGNAVKRADYFKKFLEEFGVDYTDMVDDMSCVNEGAFLEGSAGHYVSYFTKEGAEENECKIVPWMTGYSMYARDDYKRCVCDSWGSGAADCPQA
jgi:chitodextrinase